MGAREQGAVPVGLGWPGSGFTSVAKPLGKERATERTGSPGLGSRGPSRQGPWTKRGRDTPRVEQSGGRSWSPRPNPVPAGLRRTRLGSGVPRTRFPEGWKRRGGVGRG